MKGLFQKDLQLILCQRRFLFLYFILIGAFLLYNPSFGIVYLFLLAAVFLVKTIAFDESNEGMLTIFSWPVSRKEYVFEKYLLSLGIPLLLALLVLTGLTILSITPLDEGLSYILYGLLATALTVSLAIPVELKFGAQKSGIVLALLGAAIFLVIYFSDQGLFLNILTEFVQTWTRIQFLILISFILTVILTVSIFTSLAILKRKEF